MKIILLAVVLPATVVHVTALILMMSALDRRGMKTNFLLARIFAFKYISQYKEVTRKETGKTGVLYSLWIGSIIVAVAAALAAVFIRWT
jgi:hypothetical protein